jgi:hypothetical protein
MDELADRVDDLEKRLSALHEQRAAIEAEIESTTQTISNFRAQSAQTDEQQSNDFCVRPGVAQYDPVNSYPTDGLPSGRNIVTRQSSGMEKYGLFLSLFEGRPDVHAKRFFSKKQNKSGYSPHCLNWYKPSCPKKRNPKTKCKNCESPSFPGITLELFLAHARGEKDDCSDVLGAYPLDDDGLCAFIVADFDDDVHGGADKTAADKVSYESMQATSLAFYKTCRSLQIPAHLEISRSGHGMHVWLFFFRESFGATGA